MSSRSPGKCPQLKLFFLLASSMLISGGLHAGDVDAGKQVSVKCMACHAVEKDVTKIGPSLYGIIGRKSGTLASFPRYSEAMKTADIVWQEDTIREFLKAPRTYVPNTLMFFPGIQDHKEVDNLLAYLQTLK